ncbi:MAG: HD domain-containing protein [Pseudomonadota bacterium]
MTTLNYAAFPFDLGIIPSNSAAHIVGGSARDLLLGLKPVDYDISVSGKPEEFAGELARNTGGRLVIMGKPGKMVSRVVTPTLIFDITAFRGATIESDLNERDFTINAIAYDLSTGRLIDPLNGREDLAKKQVKRVSETAFRDDPVRLLRAYRMAASLGFAIAPETILLIKRDAELIKRTAGERVREELFKILAAPNSHRHLMEMSDSGLLFSVLPELKPLCGCEQNRHHHHDVFTHTLTAYAYLEKLIADPFGLLAGSIAPDAFNFDLKLARLLKFALLLHDIGKPACQSRDETGGIHFHGHEAAGAEAAGAICEKLRCSIKERLFITSMIALHSRPRHLYHLKQNSILTPKAITRLFMTCGENTPYLLLHADADMQGKSEAGGNVVSFTRFLGTLSERYFSNFRVKKSAAPLLTGQDLIDVFGLRPSPLFKDILQRLEEKRLSDDRIDRKTAMDLVERILRERR